MNEKDNKLFDQGTQLVIDEVMGEKPWTKQTQCTQEEKAVGSVIIGLFKKIVELFRKKK